MAGPTDASPGTLDPSHALDYARRVRSPTKKLDAPDVALDEPARRKISGAEFDRLVAEGFFGPEERLELVGGEIVVMSPIGDEHAVTVTCLTTNLSRVLLPEHFVWAQNPFKVGAHRLYPDAAIVRGEVGEYRRRTPTPRDAALVIEVADTTLAYDRGEKSEIYAAGGVSEYWIVDLSARTVEVRRRPLRRRGVFAESVVLEKGSLRAPSTRRRIGLASFLG